MIEKQIEDRIRHLEGKIGIYYKDLKSGNTVTLGNNDLFIAAGLSKLFLLLEVQRQIEFGELLSNQTYKLKPEDKMPSIGALMNLHDGIELTIEDLCKLMISVGDNSAFNILTDIIGFEAINKTLDSLGLFETRVRRKFFDQAAIKNGIENIVSITELGNFLDRLYTGKIISNTVSQKVLDILKLQQRAYIIPYHFSEMVMIAHQLGEDEGILHDAGIVYSKNEFILCMCSNNVNVKKAQNIMRDVSLLSMQFSNILN